ncbi:MAG: hypothetical protein ACRCUY_09065 [Thermoguttaceae bacterium]
MTFAELIQWKEGILMRLVPISERQLEIVRRGEVTDLLSLLGQKQKIMDEFEDVERQLAPFRNMKPEERQWKDDSERSKTAEAIDRCASMLKQILEHDNISTNETALQRDEIAEQLRRVRQGSNVSQIYAKQSDSSEVQNFRHDA